MIISRTREATGANETIERLKVSLEEAHAQTARLERLIRLEERARHAAGRRAPGFVMMNDTLSVVSYRQVAIWWRSADGEGEGFLEGLSGARTLRRMRHFRCG